MLLPLLGDHNKEQAGALALHFSPSPSPLFFFLLLSCSSVISLPSLSCSYFPLSVTPAVHFRLLALSLPHLCCLLISLISPGRGGWLGLAWNVNFSVGRMIYEMAEPLAQETVLEHKQEENIASVSYCCSNKLHLKDFLRGGDFPFVFFSLF